MVFTAKNLGSPKSDPESPWIPLESPLESTLESLGIPHRIPSWKITRHMQESISMYFHRHTCWQTWLNASLLDGNGANPLSTLSQPRSSVYLNTPWAESAHGVFDGNGAKRLSTPSQPPSSVYLNTPWAESACGVFDGNGANPLSTPLFRLLKYSMG